MKLIKTSEANDDDIDDFPEDPKDYDDGSFLSGVGNDYKMNNLDGGFYDDYGYSNRHSDLLKSLTDFDPFLKQMVSEWLGMVWSEADNKWVHDKSIKPMMNLQGARYCVNFLRPYTRSNNVLTSLDEDTYRNIMEEVIEQACMNIGTRGKREFGIDNIGNMRTVYTQLIHSVQLILIGASGNNTYRTLLGDTLRRNETVGINQNMPMMQQSQMKQNKSWIDKLKFWG